MEGAMASGTFATPPSAGGRTASRLKMDPEYAAALKRLCEQPAPLGSPAPPPSSERAGDKLRWAEQLRVLVQRELLLAREVLPPNVVAERELGAEIAPIAQYAKEKAAARDAERAKLTRELRELREDGAAARALMLRVSTSPSYLDELRGTMESLEARLTASRAQLTRASLALAREEEELSAELAEHASDFDAWAALGPARPPKGAAGAAAAARTRPRSALSTRTRAWAAAPEDHARRPTTAGAEASDGAEGEAEGADEASRAHTAAIAELDAKLAKLGGPTCGWEASEHDELLRLRAQLGAVPFTSPRLLALAARRLRSHTEHEVRAHAAACEAREGLLAHKRELVAAWRAARSATAAQRAQRELELEERAAAREAEARAAARAAAARARAARDEEVARWQAAKAAEAAAAEAAKREADEELKRRREREAREQIKQRAEFEARLAERAARDAAVSQIVGQREAEARAERARRTRAELRRLRARDEQLLAKAVEQRRKREEEKEAQEKRKEQLMARGTASTPRGVQRDPERLLQSTHAIERRIEDDREARAAPRSRLTSFGGEKGVPPSRRATPSWRSAVY